MPVEAGIAIHMYKTISRKNAFPNFCIYIICFFGNFVRYHTKSPREREKKVPNRFRIIAYTQYFLVKIGQLINCVCLSSERVSIFLSLFLMAANLKSIFLEKNSRKYFLNVLNMKLVMRCVPNLQCA